jgi:hypothetical protein
MKTQALELILKISKPEGMLSIITQSGCAIAYSHSFKVPKQIQKSLAMLKILDLSSKDVEKGKVLPLEDVLQELKSLIQKR